MSECTNKRMDYEMTLCCLMLPTSTIWPLETTAMQSASLTVLSRWAITRTVLPRQQQLQQQQLQQHPQQSMLHCNNNRPTILNSDLKTPTYSFKGKNIYQYPTPDGSMHSSRLRMLIDIRKSGSKTGYISLTTGFRIYYFVIVFTEITWKLPNVR